MNSYAYRMITCKFDKIGMYKKINEYIVLDSYVEQIYVDTRTNEKYYRENDGKMLMYNPIFDGPTLDMQQVIEQYPEVLIWEVQVK